MKILITYGTRPEWIKVKPLIEELNKRNIEHYTLFTGQHVDIAPDDADFVFDQSHVIGNNRLDSVVGNILKSGDDLYYYNEDKEFTHVLVQGDTTSAMAVALSAFHHRKKVIHLEAGLRSFDKENPYPEETNRKIISQIADIHLCPTLDSLINLRSENINKDVFIVGNTALDNLLNHKDMCEYGDTILITLHRRENHEIMDHWFEAVNNLAKKYPYYNFILPLHPNPNVQKHKHLLTNVSIINPLSHEELLNILVKTRLVITDSGGIQEECSFLNKKCLVCRLQTERPEAVGKSSFMVFKPELLEKTFEVHINDYQIDTISPFGDGHSAAKIVDILYKND